MAYDLIIAEKPASAQKIAEALSDTKPKKEEINKVPYYELEHNGKPIVVGSAVGHLFSLAEKKKKGYAYPVFDVEWKPLFEIKKDDGRTKGFYLTLQKLSKNASSVTIACDYDSEGSVIGWNCLHYIAKKDDGRRMKFSTLTKEELIESYENASPHLDFPQIKAGETRHTMDYFYGISLSRALMAAIKAAGSFKIMSAGRVQGPALKIIVDREREIKAFVPEPFWHIDLKAIVNKLPLLASHKKGRFWEKKEAQQVYTKTKGKNAVVESLDQKEQIQQSPHPFDLTSLQLESYRCFGISPKETQQIAQDLYVAGLISYPRTSSQQLPAAINYKKILTKLSKQPSYSEHCQKLLSQSSLQPNNGKKTDPAHPAIYPTGEITSLADKKKKVYDLVVHRFLATFAPPAKRIATSVILDVNGEKFGAQGITIKEHGWQIFYNPYTSFKEEILPALQKGQVIQSPDITLNEDQTKPPKRYTPASLIKELEKRGLGTKATRSQIIESLYDRNYLKEKSIEATELGIATIDTLGKYCPSIIDEKLTRHFEQDMEKILQEKKQPEKVLAGVKVTLTKTLEEFRKHEKEIGAGLLVATRETERIANTIGQCPVCKEGQLMLRRGRFGMFAACNKYPACKTTFSVPRDALLKPLEEKCPACSSFMLMVIRKGKRPWKYCLNKNCPKKEEWRQMMAQKQAENNNSEDPAKAPPAPKVTVKKKRTSKKPKQE